MKILFYALLLLAFIDLNLKAQVITQPTEPTSGYGSNVYPYDSVIKLNYDDGATGVMIYIPASPHVDSLPVVIFNHGYSAWNPMSYAGWINHIVLRGNIVIFPRYQLTELTSPAVFTTNAVTGYLRAIDTLHAHPSYTQPILTKLCIVGHSYGGVVTANMAEDYATYGMPKPRAFMAAAPGYGTAPSGALPTYRNIDTSIYMLPIFEKDDDVVDSVFALELFDSTATPYSHKNLVVHHPDSLGTPPLISAHGASCSVDSSYDNGDTGPIITLANTTSTTDAVDFYCYWKLFDALQDCALNGKGCATAFGDTYTQKYMGTWSNGTPVVPLEIRPVVYATGITAVNKKDEIITYPNPAQESFTISLPNNHYNIVISDITGRKIYEGKSITGQAEIDSGSFSSGIYFVQAQSTNQVFTKKIIISR